MQRALALCLIVALLALPPVRPAFAATAATHSSELWHVSTVADPTTHKFSYCSVESGFDNGLYLAFARNRDLNTNIVVSFPDKRLEEKTKFRMLVAIDSYPVREMIGFSAANDTLVIPLQHDRKLIEWLQKGKLLDLKGPSDSAKFALDGAGDAIRQLELCVETNLKTEVATANGKPEARPNVATGPLASNQAPGDEAMVEPLPLPATAPDSYAPTLAPPISAPSQPKTAPPQQGVTVNLPPAAAAPANIEQSDEAAARTEAARLATLRQRGQQAAMASTTPVQTEAIQTGAAQAADEQRQAADDDAARAAYARLPASKSQDGSTAPVPSQPVGSSPANTPTAPPISQAAVVAAPVQQAAIAPASRTLPTPPPRSVQPTPTPQVPVQTAMLLDTPVQSAPSVPPQLASPAPLVQPTPTPQPRVQTPPPVVQQTVTQTPAQTSIALDTPVQIVPSAPATAPIVAGKGASLPGLLQQSGIPVRAQGPDVYVWSQGAIAGEARETNSGKAFTDAMLDDLDAREKSCKGAFSSTMEAPVAGANLSYAQVTTGCGVGTGSVGVILYYQARDKFGVIGQETTLANRTEAESMRARLKQSLQTALQANTNYK